MGAFVLSICRDWKKERMVFMVNLEHDLLTTKYTEVYHEPKEEMKFNAPHHFVVAASEYKAGEPQPILATIDFQEGPIKEAGVNGVCNEDLIAMVICRLEHFQRSEFSCRENALAITKLEEALLWLRKRTMGREKRGVEGTHVK
jgi:hypothetical protein